MQNNKKGVGGILPTSTFTTSPDNREYYREKRSTNLNILTNEIMGSLNSGLIFSPESADLALKNITADLDFFQDAMAQETELAERLREGILTKKAEYLHQTTMDCLFIERNIGGSYRFNYPNRKVVAIAHLTLRSPYPDHIDNEGHRHYKIPDDNSIRIIDEVNVFVSQPDAEVTEALLRLSQRYSNAPIWNTINSRTITSIAVPGLPYPRFIKVNIGEMINGGLDMYKLTQLIDRDDAEIHTVKEAGI